MTVSVSAGCSSAPTTPSPPPAPVPDPPLITCPAPAPQISATGQAIPVTFTPSVLLGAAPVTTTCTPASGSTFPVGSSTVTCTATDARQRTASCSFTVVIQPAPRLLFTRFVAFGDSITLGEDGTTTIGAFDLAHFLRPDYPTVVLVGREYPTVLRSLLAARYTTQQFTMVNAGRQAERLGNPDTLRRFTDVVASRAYDVVLLMEGTNDIYGGTGGNPLGIAPAIGNLRQMIRDARSRGVRVFLATVPPQNPAGGRGALGYQVVPLLNAEIRTVALTEGVPLVDVYDAFNGNLSLLAGDGLHPNAEGFARIAAKFYDVVQERLEASLVGPVPTLSGVEDAGGADRTNVLAHSARP